MLKFSLVMGISIKDLEKSNYFFAYERFLVGIKLNGSTV